MAAGLGLAGRVSAGHPVRVVTPESPQTVSVPTFAAEALPAQRVDELRPLGDHRGRRLVPTDDACGPHDCQ